MLDLMAMAATASNSNGQSGARFTLRALMVFMTLLCIACGGLAYLKELLRNPFPPGQFTNRDELAQSMVEPWLDFEDAADANGLRIANAEYFRVHYGWDPTYFIRFDDSQDLFDLLVKKKGLSPVSTPAWYYRRFWEDMPANWPTRPATVPKEMYACGSLHSGGEGDQYVVLRDRKAGKIYVWYHFNF